MLGEPTPQSNQVLGNFIGTDPTGALAVPNSNAGLYVAVRAVGNIVGGTGTGGGNLISGNRDVGVSLEDTGTNNNRVLGNRIGTKADGSSVLPNAGGYGIVIMDGAASNIIGGPETGAGNLISGHAANTHSCGIQIQNAPRVGVINNQVIGNLIGLNSGGTAALPNSNGVLLIAGPTNTLIDRNVIAGNTQTGIEFDNTSHDREQYHPQPGRAYGERAALAKSP